MGSRGGGGISGKRRKQAIQGAIKTLLIDFINEILCLTYYIWWLCDYNLITLSETVDPAIGEFDPYCPCEQKRHAFCRFAYPQRLQPA